MLIMVGHCCVLMRLRNLYNPDLASLEKRLLRVLDPSRFGLLRQSCLCDKTSAGLRTVLKPFFFFYYTLSTRWLTEKRSIESLISHKSLQGLD